MTEISNHSEEEARRLIVDLSHRQKPISEAIEYFETQYINDPDKDKVVHLTKDYIADALAKVAEDVNMISSNLDQYLSRQVDTVDEISHSLGHISMRLRMLKQQHGAARLMKMRQDKPPPPKEAKKRQDSATEADFERVPIAAHMNKYSAVGISLVDDEEAEG